MSRSAYCFMILFGLINLVAIPADNAALQENFKGWLQTETAHFVFVYEQKDQAALDELLTFCEEVYAQVTRYFDSYPERIPVILRGRIDSANGYFSPMPFKIELYITAPTEPWLGARTESWLKLLFIHELTHYIHLVQEQGFWAGLAQILGEELKVVPMFAAPGWMIEGITTSFETMFTSGGRGRNPFFEIYYKALILKNTLPSLSRMAYNSPFPPPDRVYVGGYILVNYLMEQYGTDVFARIHREFVKFPFFGPWRAIRKVTGKSAKAIYKQMLGALQERYHADSLIPAGRCLTPAGYNNYTLPRFTERGWYLYRSSFERFPALVRFDPHTGQEEILLECLLTDATSFTASADGNNIYFTSLTKYPFHRAEPSVVSDLYHYQVATGKRRPLVRHAHLWHPALSPDGTKLVAVQGNGAYTRLVEIDPRTGALRLIYDPGEANIYNPVFSPDGRKLAFVMNVRGMQDLYILNYTEELTGNGNGISDLQVVPVLGTDYTGEYYPRFIDDERLTFISDRNGRLELWLAYLNRQDLLLLCQDPVGVLDAALWQDKVVYRSYTSEGFCLKEKKAAELLNRPETWPAFEPYPPSLRLSQPESTQTERESRPENRPFADPAWPQIWLPYPSLNFITAANWTWGFGLAVYGRSLLDETDWLALLAYHPYERQPLANFSWQRAFGRLFLGYQCTQSYFLTDQGYRQSTSQWLRADLPLLHHTFWPYATQLTFNLGANYRWAAFADHSFGFSESFSFPAEAYEQRLVLLPGLTWVWLKTGAVRDFYDPWKLTSSIDLAVPLPVFDNQRAVFDMYSLLAWQFPSFLPHQVFKLGAKASYTTALPGNSFFSIVPRGGFITGHQTDRGRILCALDYLFTIALLDAPLLYNFNLRGLSGGFHLEAAASWDFEQDSWQFDKYLYTGLELTALVHNAGFSLPLGLGVAVRFDPLFRQPFNAATDMGLYFFLSLDSFRAFFRDPAYPGRHF